MALDLAAVQRAYFGGPPGPDFNGIPTREERVAESERVLVRLCIERGQDPACEGRGEHGALIGGESKPVRLHEGNSRPMAQYCKPRLAPVCWFEHAGGRATSGLADPNHARLAVAIASHMAGTPHTTRPSPPAMHEAFVSENPSDLELFWLHSVLSCVSVNELRKIVHFEGYSLRTTVRALHLSGVLRHDLTNWLNQFACPPP